MANPASVRETDFSDADYDAIVGVTREADPEELMGKGALREYDTNLATSGLGRTWFIAARAGEVVGHARINQPAAVADPKIWRTAVMVRPAFTRLGIGTLLHGVAQRAVLEREGRRLWSSVREDVPEATRFAERQGYRLIGRDWQSTADPSTFDAAPWQEVLETVAAQGIEITSLAVLRETVDDWLPRLYDLYMRIEADVPSRLPLAPIPLDLFVRQWIESDYALLDGFLVARDGIEWIGLTEVFAVEGEANALLQDLTGVLGRYRRRRIATALKITAMIWAKERGCRVLRTWNAESNVGMLAINGELGFVREHPAAEYLKELDG